MVKFTKEDIKRAYMEFSSDKEWVSADSHEIVAYDYLVSNMPLQQYLYVKGLFPLYLFCCLDKISHADTLEERITLINDYCKKNNITYTQHQDLDMICKIGASINMPSFYEGYMEMVNAPIHKSEEYEEVISLLSHKIRMSMLSNVRFGIMEYYSYFNVDLLKLKSYIEQKPSIDTKNELVLSFINELESANALEKVEYTEALKVKEPKKFINGIYINDRVFRGAVSKLLVSRYPVLTGTLDYAYTLYEKGRLENLSKQKIKTRFEEKIERGRKHGGCS